MHHTTIILGGCLFILSGCAVVHRSEAPGETDSDPTGDTATDDADSESTTDTFDDATEPDTTTDETTESDTTVTSEAAEMNWVVVEPGTFTMGSPVDEYRHGLDETRREVTLGHRFAILNTEVTCAQWQAIPTSWSYLCEPMECPYGDTCSDRCLDGDCPVTPMGVDAAKEWLDALSEKEGLSPCYKNAGQFETPIHCPGYRLPTESEWEMAARAGDGRATYAGNFVGNQGRDVLESIAWVGDILDNPDRDMARPVARGLPNDLGLYDMIGNVAELALWEGKVVIPAPRSPYGDLDSGFIVERGCSYKGWDNGFDYCRAAARLRFANRPDSLQSAVGLRPVRTLSGGELPDIQQISWCGTTPRIPDDCSASGFTNLSRRHTREEDALYTDMAVANHTIALIGNSTETGAFVEVADAGDIRNMMPGDSNGFRFHAPQETFKSMTGKQVIALKDGDTEFIAVLCDDTTVTCRLFDVAMDEVPGLLPLPNGEIPSWLGSDVSLLYLGNDAIYVAGNGIAFYDGTAWHDEVPPDAKQQFTGIDGAATSSGTFVAAAGQDGLLMVKDETDWHFLTTGTTETLLSVVAGYNDYQGLFLTAPGTRGQYLTGTIKSYSVCDMGSPGIEKFVSGISAAGLITDYHTYIEFHWKNNDGVYQPTCAEMALPDNWLDTINFTCGESDNLFHLASDGLYAEEYNCLIE